MRRVRWVRWGVPLLAGLALVSSSVACGAGQFRLRSATAEPAVDLALGEDAPPAAAEPTATAVPAPTIAPTMTPSPTPSPIRVAVVQVKALRVRAGPGTQHVIVGGVRQGQQLEVAGQNEDGSWLQVKGGGLEGWVAAEFVQVSQAAPSSRPVQAPVSGGAGATAGGVRVARRDIVAFYENLGFTFVPETTADGQEQLTGANHAQQATVQLIGPEDALNTLAMTAVTRYDQETVVLSAAYLLGFISRILPEWPEGPAWVEEHLREAKNGITSRTAFGDTAVTLSGSQEVVTLALTAR